VASGSAEQEHLIPNLYGLPHRESKHKKNLLDLKGGPHGYRPKGHHDNILNDPKFKQKVQEVNKDPTGLGKPWNEILADLKKTQEEEVSLGYKPTSNPLAFSSLSCAKKRSNASMLVTTLKCRHSALAVNIRAQAIRALQRPRFPPQHQDIRANTATRPDPIGEGQNCTDR
jgi:hypothetical protein